MQKRGVEETLQAVAVTRGDENVYVLVADIPRVHCRKVLEFVYKDFVGEGFQMVKGVAQGAAPFLVPVRPAARGASAVTVPASDTVGATPCTAFAVEVLQEDFVLRREFLEIPAVVDRHHVVLGGVAVVEPGGAHVAERFVVPVAFAVGTDAYQLRVFAVGVPGVADAASEGVRVAEQVLEPHSRRKPGIVEKDVQVTVTEMGNAPPSVL